jgi:hypothetical protein
VDFFIRREAIMAAKQLAFEADARAALLAGVEKLAAAVKPTLGAGPVKVDSGSSPFPATSNPDCGTNCGMPMSSFTLQHE